MASPPQTLAFRWRAEKDTPIAAWAIDSARFGEGDTVGDVRRRLAPTCGSTALLAGPLGPEVRLCDDRGNVALHPEDTPPEVVLAWTPSTYPRLLLELHPNGRPRAVLVFTFPPADVPGPAPNAPVPPLVPLGVAAFWHALMRTEPAPDGFLSLPDGVHWFGDGRLGSRLMVRRCYVDLCDLMQAAAAENRNPDWIVTGNPGIGKTFFAGYAMWFFARHGRTIVWEPPQTGSNDRYLLRPNGSLGLGDASARSFALELQDPRTLVVTDAHSPPIVNARTLLVTSPRKPAYYEYWKQRSAKLRYMPPWTLLELEVGRAGCFPAVPPQRMADLFAWWGGIPRAVLAGAQDDDDAFAPLEQAIDACNVQACVYSVGLIAGPEDLTHRIIHVLVADDGTYARPRLRFASDHVAARLVEKFARHERERLLTFLRAAEGDRYAGGLRGHLFEHWAHRVLAAGGTFQVRDLRTDRDDQLTLPPLAVEDFRTLEEMRVRPGVYCRPWKDNLAAVDAVAAWGAQCVLLQMTVAERHPLKAAGVEAVLQRLPAGAAPALVLAVPGNVFGVAQATGFVVGGGDNRMLAPGARLDRLAAIPQYALLVPLT